MRIIIDFGTSRTAVAGVKDDSTWQSFSPPQGNSTCPPTPNWSTLKDLIDGVGSMKLEQGRIPHLITFSRYCDINKLIVPVSIEGTTVLFPAGTNVIPPPPGSPGDFTFTSIKDKGQPQWASSFLGALAKIIRAWSSPQAQWVIGRSCGAIDPAVLSGLPPGTIAFNEAVAVIFALVSLDKGKLLSNASNKFVVLADLGGGFLDVSVAHNIVLDEEDGQAEIVNYGGYTLGVDRLGQRFSRDSIANPDPLCKLLVGAIAYHIWDYCQRHPVNTSGVVFLTGGGFKRLGKSYHQIDKQLAALIKQIQQTAGVTVEIIRHDEFDTKLLTIAGLSRMAKLGLSSDTEHPEKDISQRHPNHHGQPVWSAQKIQLAPGMESWAGFLEAELRSAYQKN